MDKKGFIECLIREVHQPAVYGTIKNLESPPGRQPSEKLVDLSKWYLAQSPETRSRIASIVNHAVHSGVFGLLCVLDNVRQLAVDGMRIRLELLIAFADQRQLINNPREEDLHDVYNQLLQEMSTPEMQLW